MTLSQAAEILSNISYKPGHTLTLMYGPGYDFVVFKIVGMVPDALSNKQELIPIVYKEWFDETYFSALDEKTWLQIIQIGIQRFEQHEINEWLRYKGNYLVDPHPEQRVAVISPPEWKKEAA